MSPSTRSSTRGGQPTTPAGNQGARDAKVQKRSPFKETLHRAGEGLSYAASFGSKMMSGGGSGDAKESGSGGGWTTARGKGTSRQGNAPPGQSPIKKLPLPNDDREWIKEDWGVRSNARNAHFERGMIIRIQHHETSTLIVQPEEDSSESRRITLSQENGPIYSKQRLAIILWKTFGRLICVPLYTFNGDGIGKIKDNGWGLNEYVQILEQNALGFQRIRGTRAPLVANMYDGHDLDLASCVHVGGLMNVDRRGDIAYIGKLNTASLTRLHNLIDDVRRECMLPQF